MQQQDGSATATHPLQVGPQPLNTPEELRAIRQAMGEGKNPLIATDVPRWEDQVGVSRIINRRVLELEPLPTPAQVLAELPLTDKAQEIVAYSRDEIRACLYGQDDRLLVIVGPCSVHDPQAALDYAHRLAALKDELGEQLLIVMRVYFEKPRTTVGWKGLINDPDIDGSHNIKKGLLLARKTLLGVLDEGLAAATEFLEPTSPQFISDAVSWGAIGARNTESQIHRQLASGLSMPVGFKNATDGSVKAAVNGCFAAAQQHTFFGIDHLGLPVQSRHSATRIAMWCCVVPRTARTTMPNPWLRPWVTCVPKCPPNRLRPMALSSIARMAIPARMSIDRPK